MYHPGMIDGGPRTMGIKPALVTDAKTLIRSFTKPVINSSDSAIDIIRLSHNITASEQRKTIEQIKIRINKGTVTTADMLSLRKIGDKHENADIRSGVWNTLTLALFQVAGDVESPKPGSHRASFDRILGILGDLDTLQPLREQRGADAPSNLQKLIFADGLTQEQKVAVVKEVGRQAESAPVEIEYKTGNGIAILFSAVIATKNLKDFEQVHQGAIDELKRLTDSSNKNAREAAPEALSDLKL